MADKKRRSRFARPGNDVPSSFSSSGTEPTRQFDRLPEAEANSAPDLSDIEFVEARRAADVEAAGLRHWTEPASGTGRAGTGPGDDSTITSRGPSWQGEGPSGAVPDLADVFADTEAIPSRTSQRGRSARVNNPETVNLGRTSAGQQDPTVPPAMGGSPSAPRRPKDGQGRGDTHQTETTTSLRSGDMRRVATGGGSSANSSGRAQLGPSVEDPLDDIEDFRRGGRQGQPNPDGFGAPEHTEPNQNYSDSMHFDDRGGADPRGHPPQFERGGQGPIARSNAGLDENYAEPEDQSFYADNDYSEPPPNGRDFTQSTLVGVALAVAVFAVLFFGPLPTMVLIALAAVQGSNELFIAMRKARLRPATLLGLVGAAAFPLAAYFRGVEAFPLVVGLTVIFGMLWYLTGADTERPVLNLGLTFTGIFWVGGLAAFGALIVQGENGTGLLFTTIIITVASDSLAYIGGRSYGKTPFHDSSPNKTWEGTITGFFGALFIGAVIGVTGLVSVFDNSFLNVIVLAAVVGILAPIGDLAESLIKRELGVKDMGTIIPGHGGILDRVDGLLFALPGAYYVAIMLNLFT